jgi:hypothetical protein
LIVKPRLLIASLAGAAALSVGASSAVAAGGATCKYKSLTNSTTVTSGTLTGPVKCSKPAGKGKATFKYSAAIVPGKMSLKLVYSGSFNDKFKKGSFGGSFKMRGVLIPPSSPSVTLSGKFKIKHGKGKLRKAHGGGTITCTSSDFTRHFSCTMLLTKGKL